MFLKSLVVRGFKSFADKTTLLFEPGITIVVGPNGSGKSNVVDAISWVLGEQGARSLRGGKMEDVIFAGSRLRPALGFAEVSLTIDNSAGLLPIEFSEVTISRALFRSGESEYKLNGAPCRLLDIQEVLSDTGVGREQHTIIGQGQLDAVLQADPIQMRGFIEEAAGIGKHRRRKDRALRKIAGTEQNLVRLSDLLSEIRRQLRPLREQAEVAKRHGQMADEFGRVRLIIQSRELSRIRQGLGPAEAVDLDAVIRMKETELSEVQRRLIEAEDLRTASFGASEKQREAAWRLSRLVERLAALAKLAAEREKTLDAELASATEAAAQAKVKEVERQLAEIAIEEQRAATEGAQARDVAQQRALAAEETLAVLRSSEEALVPVRAAHREASAEEVRVRGEIAALSASIEAAEKEKDRLESQTRSLNEALSTAVANLEQARGRSSELEASEEPLAEALDLIEAEIVSLEARRDEVQQRLRHAERDVARWRALAEVRSGSSPDVAVRVVEKNLPGVMGVLSDLISIPAEFERAFAALFGQIGSVVVVADRDAAENVIASAAEEGTISLLVAERAQGPRPIDVTPLTQVVPVGSSDVAVALSDFYVAGSVDEASRLAARYPHAVFVTAQGAVAMGRLVSRGPADAVVRASEAEQRLAEAELELQEIEASLAEVRSRWDEQTSKLNELDAAMAAQGERLFSAEREVHALEREVQAIAETAERSSGSVGALIAKLDELKTALPRITASIEAKNLELQHLQEENSRAVAAHSSAAAVHEEARTQLMAINERLRLIEDRKRGLDRALQAANDSAAGIEGVRARLLALKQTATDVTNKATSYQQVAEGWAEEADQFYRASREKLDALDARIDELRTDRTARAGALDDMRSKAREEDLSRSELRIRARILEERMAEEWQVNPDEMVTKFGHHWEVEDESRLEDPLAKLAAMDDEALRRKHNRLERDLAQIGRVNPLAEQEFDALTQREEFLAAQIADVRASRRDLFKVVSSVDEKVRGLFGSAFEDVAREYERLFAMLFPGGQGRLRLTDPTDLLMTGVEVEARPGGKNLKRLSLLSGGERALSALAVLFAIFRARPSPFYILDEVEAALDDVNLHRFLGLLREFRDSSQLLVVTHQKRTMEAADVLYGVSIKPDGASRVISQKLSAQTPQAHEVRGRVSTES